MRSKLFVPASRPELFAKALAGDADALSFDLEDAVQESRKADARRTLEEFLRQVSERPPGKVLIVRVNGLTTPHFEADLRAVAWPGVDMINLPKPESAEAVRAAAAALARVEAERRIGRPIGILANIESPRGLRLALEIATAHPRVVGLQLGLGDLFEPYGIDRADARAVHATQLTVRVAAAEAGIWACDTVYGPRGDSASSASPASIRPRSRSRTRCSGRATPRSPRHSGWSRRRAGPSAAGSGPSWWTAA